MPQHHMDADKQPDLEGHASLSTDARRGRIGTAFSTFYINTSMLLTTTDIYPFPLSSSAMCLNDRAIL